jgi:hypothetical protein
MSYLIKIGITALLVISAAEFAKRFTSLGAVLISLPIASIIAMSFLYYDTRNTAKVAEFARSIPLAIIPSIAFFYTFSFLAERNLGFVMSMVLSIGLMLCGYSLYLFLTLRNG